MFKNRRSHNWLATKKNRKNLILNFLGFFTPARSSTKLYIAFDNKYSLYDRYYYDVRKNVNVKKNGT